MGGSNLGAQTFHPCRVPTSPAWTFGPPFFRKSKAADAVLRYALAFSVWIPCMWLIRAGKCSLAYPNLRKELTLACRGVETSRGCTYRGRKVCTPKFVLWAFPFHGKEFRRGIPCVECTLFCTENLCTQLDKYCLVSLRILEKREMSNH